MKRKLGTSAAMWGLEVGKFNSISVKKGQRRGMDPEETCFCLCSLTSDDAAGRPSRGETWCSRVRSLRRPSFISRTRWFHVHASWKNSPFLGSISGSKFRYYWLIMIVWTLGNNYMSDLPLLSVSTLILLLCVRHLRLIDTVVCPNPFPLLLIPSPLIHTWILETFLCSHCIWTPLKMYFFPVLLRKSMSNKKDYQHLTKITSNELVIKLFSCS